MDSDTPLRLLIVENSRNEAQGYIRALRNAGIAVRPEVAEDDEDVEEWLGKQPFDMLLTIDTLEGVTLARLFELVHAKDPALPILVATDSFDESHVLAALRLGACGVFAKSSAEQLQLVITREATALQHSRALGEARRVLAETEARCQDLLGSSRDAIAYAHEGMHIYANPAYLELFGYAGFDELEGMPLMDMVSPDEQGQLKEFLRQFTRGETDQNQLELTGLKPDGSQFAARMDFAPANYEGEACTQITIRDRSGDLALQEQLETLSRLDTVTGLLNRTAFLDQLGVRLSAGGLDKMQLLFVAIDDFKSVKEQVGLAATDATLQAFAKLLQEQLGDGGLVARFSDQAFALVAEGLDTDAAVALAGELRKRVEGQLFEVGEQAVSMTCSIGVSPVEARKPAHAIVAQADLACENAQSAGGNRVERHNPVSYARQTQQRDQLMVEMIKEAGKQGRFRLYYQPIVSLTGNSEENYEVFLRMFDEHGEAVPPAQFLPAAQQSGQIAALERWVIGNAVHILAKRHKGGHRTRLFINLTESTLADHDLVGWTAEQLKKTGLTSEALVFEIDEPAISGHIGDARTFCEGLKKLGCGIAVDHFNGSANAFNCLAQVPADYLKLDRSFASALSKGGDELKKLKETTARGHELQKKVIAAFVEDASHLATLWQCQVDLIQGYFLQEPSASMTFDFEGESL